MAATVAAGLGAVVIGAGLAGAAYLRPEGGDVSIRDVVPYTNPADNGGTSLGHFPDNQAKGEPLNLIISGASSPEINTLDGFTLWANSIDFGKECLGLHSGTKMQANVGDGQGLRDQENEFRDLLGIDPDIGACAESLVGGNHFRYWQQSTTKAWFLACSVEENVTQSHNITADGYNKGRDDIVQKALANPTYKGKKYTSTVEYITGYLPIGADQINHDISIDGKTAVITVTVTPAEQKKSKRSCM